MSELSEFSWTTEKFSVVVKQNGQEVLRLHIGEILESVDRSLIEKHITIMKRTPWIKEW